MANGIAQSFIGGVGQANQLKSQQLTQQQQRAEYERFLDKSNLTSMVQAGLEFRTITDPVQQDAYLKNRIAGIKQRGGDSRDTEELLALPPEERVAAVDNLINIGERFGVIKADPTTSGVKFGFPHLLLIAKWWIVGGLFGVSLFVNLNLIVGHHAKFHLFVFGESLVCPLFEYPQKFKICLNFPTKT